MNEQETLNLIIEFENNIYDYAILEEMKYNNSKKYIYYCCYQGMKKSNLTKQEIIDLFNLIVLVEDK